eukprot:c13270_g1_i1.p1 GENE.c13270_g1_i1~~c13270_g1_i1.p1  ORF type:complete len:191 (-),score=29.49 c13270_g1_i1:257-745(-)
MLYHFALLCLARCDITASDAALLCELNILAFNSHPVQEDGPATSFDAQLIQLTNQCKQLMAHKISFLMPLLLTHPESFSKSTCLVFQKFDHNHVEWNRFVRKDTNQTNSVQAFVDGNYYHLNVLTGSVLLNGYPPRRLPKSFSTTAVSEQRRQCLTNTINSI